MSYDSENPAAHPGCNLLHAKLPDGFEASVLDASLGYFPQNCYLSPVSKFYPSTEAIQRVYDMEPADINKLDPSAGIVSPHNEPVSSSSKNIVPTIQVENETSVEKSVQEQTKDSLKTAETKTTKYVHKASVNYGISTMEYCEEINELKPNSVLTNGNIESTKDIILEEDCDISNENRMVTPNLKSLSVNQSEYRPPSCLVDQSKAVHNQISGPWPPKSPAPPRCHSLQHQIGRRRIILADSTTTDSSTDDRLGSLPTIDNRLIRRKRHSECGAILAAPRRGILLNPATLPHINGRRVTAATETSGVSDSQTVATCGTISRLSPTKRRPIGAKVSHGTQTKIPIIYTAVIRSLHPTNSKSRNLPRKSLDEMTCLEACRHAFSRTAKFVFSSLGLCGLLVVYLIIGAYAFMALEFAKDAEIRQRVYDYRDKFSVQVADTIWESMVNETDQQYACQSLLVSSELAPCWNRTRISQIVIELLTTFQEQVDNVTNHGAIKITPYKSNSWELQDAFLFAVTVITTIGYGNLVPHTTEGRVLTIIYALVGVPLMLITLASMGHFLGDFVRFAYQRGCQPVFRGVRKQLICDRCKTSKPVPQQPNPTNSRRRRRHHENPDNDDDQLETEKVIQIPIFVTLFILASYMLGIAAIFHQWEEWSWEEAFYFCFITFTTIGFGDFVPGSSISDSRSYKVVLTSMSVLFGLVIVSMGFNLMQDAVAIFFKKCWARIGNHHRRHSDNRAAAFDRFVKQHRLVEDSSDGERQMPPSAMRRVGAPSRGSFVDLEAAHHLDDAAHENVAYESH